MVKMLYEDDVRVVIRQPDGRIVKVVDGVITITYKSIDENTLEDKKKEIHVGIDDLILMSETLRIINKTLRNENSNLKRKLNKTINENFNLKAIEVLECIPNEEIPCHCEEYEDKEDIELDLDKLILEQKEREKNNKEF